MTRSDDMVLVPAFEVEQDTPARREAREGRLERRVPRSRLMQRLRRAATARKLRQVRARRSAARAQAMARTGARGAARAGARFAARGAARAVAHPVGAIAVAIAVATVVGIRLGTGRPLEGLGADLNESLFGDLDDRARVSSAVRSRIAANPELARIAALEGGATSQLAELYRGTVESEMASARGQSMLERRFPVDGLTDQLILRAEQAFRSAWNGGGGTTDLKHAMQRLGPDAPASGEASAR